MPLHNELIERFRSLHQKKYGEFIAYEAAEQQLRELAELVRITTPKQEISKQNG